MNRFTLPLEDHLNPHLFDDLPSYQDPLDNLDYSSLDETDAFLLDEPFFIYLHDQEI